MQGRKREVKSFSFNYWNSSPLGITRGWEIQRKIHLFNINVLILTKMPDGLLLKDNV